MSGRRGHYFKRSEGGGWRLALSFLLSVSMVTSMVPVSALAEAADELQESAAATAVEPETDAATTESEGTVQEGTTVAEPAQSAPAATETWQQTTATDASAQAEQPTAQAQPTETTTTEMPAATTEQTAATDSADASGQADAADEAYPEVTLAANAGATQVTVHAAQGVLPKGVQLTASEVSPDSVRDAVSDAAEAAGREVESLKAIDVTLLDADGNQIQPNGAVEVSFSNTGVTGDKVDVYHMDSVGAEPTKIAGDVSANPTVSATHFSIYIVTGENEPVVATYQFYGADGKVMNEQKVKNGETVYAPDSPSLTGHKFLGWTLTKDGTSADFLPVGTASTTVKVPASGTVAVYPVFEVSHTVSFMDDQGRVSTTRTCGTGETVSVSDVTIPLPSTKGVTGWYTSKEAADSQDASAKVESYTFESDDAADVTLWPHIEGGNYVTFDSQGGTYVAPEFAIKGTTVSKPTNPTRKGYTFEGWATKADASAADWDWSTKVSEATTLYAVWAPAETTYTVVIWKQSVNDSKNAADAQKTWDFAEAATRSATTGESVSPSSADKSKSWTGFSLNLSLTDKNVKVSGDGTTVVNVYYDRELRTIQYSVNGKTYKTMTGLYGQTLAQNKYTWPTEYDWYDGDTHTTFLDAFLDSRATVVLKGQDVQEGYYTASHYKQNVDGTWPSTATNSTTLPGKTWNFTNKYNGFTVSSYRFDDGAWRPASEGGSVTIRGDLQVRYSRNSYTLSFYNYNATSREEQVLYEGSLASCASYTPDRPDGLDSAYEFQGWYKDSACTQAFDFSTETMPAAGLTLYAKWAPPTKKVTAHLSMNAGGADTAAASDVTYGTTVTADDLPSVVTSDGKTTVFSGNASKGTITLPAGAEWAGWATYQDGRFVMYNFDTLVQSDVELYPFWITTDVYAVVYDANGGSGSVTDSTKYDLYADARVLSSDGLTAPEGKVFLGWNTAKDGSGTSVGVGTKLRISDYADANHNVTLYAQWGEQPKTTSLTYNANYPADSGKEAASKQVLANVENNYGGGTTGNAAGKLVASSLDGVGFSAPDDYYFTGWNTAADGSGTAVAPGATIGIDNLSANTLYAQWAKRAVVNVAITGNTASQTYSGVEQQLSGYTTTITVDGKAQSQLPDGLTLTVTGDSVSGTDAATYAQGIKYELGGESQGKYKVSVTVTNGGLTITPAKLTVTTQSATKAYDGTPLTAEGKVAGLVNNETVGLKVTGTQTEVGTSKNTYELTWAGTGNEYTAKQSNYELTESVGTLEVTTSAVAHNITADSQTWTYDGTEHTNTQATSDFDTSLFDVSVTMTDGSSIKNAGSTANKIASYKITLKDGTDVTANFTNVKTTDGTLTVERRNVTLVSATQGWTYDGQTHSDHTVTVKSGSDEPVEGETIATNVTASIKDAGSVPNAFSVDWEKSTAKESNYNVTLEPGKLTVTPDDSEVTIYVAGNTAEKVYTGSEQSVTGWSTTGWSKSATDPIDPTITVGLKDGHKAEAKGTNVGDYPMGLTSDDFSAMSKNYSNLKVEVTDGKLTITKANFAVTVTGESKTVTYDGKLHELTGTEVSGLLDGHTLNGLQYKASSTDAGTYPGAFTGSATITDASGADQTQNYSVTTTPGQLIIEAANIKDSNRFTVSEPKDTIYNGKAQRQPITVHDAVTGKDLQEGVDYDLTYTGDMVNVTDKGVTITVTGKGNYTGTVTTDKTHDLTYLITKATLTVNTDSAQKEYNGAALTAGGSYSGLVNGETIGFEVTGSQTIPGSTPNGYRITWGTAVNPLGLDAISYTALEKNYRVVENVGTLTVTKRTTQLGITAASDSKVYDGTPLESDKYDVTGKPDVLTVTAVVTGSQTDAGTSANKVASYKVTDADGNDVSSYFADGAIVTTDGTLTVKPRQITITSKSGTWTYDQKAHELHEVEVTSTVPEGEKGFVAGDGATYEFTGQQTEAGSSPNSFTYTLDEGTKTSNYVITTKLGTLTVTKAASTTIKVTGNSKKVTYDGTEQSVDGYTSNAAEVDKTISIDLAKGSKAEAKGTLAGTYQMKLKPSDFVATSLNYEKVNVEVTDGMLTIEHASIPLTITGESGSYTYDGTPKSITGITYDGLLKGHEVTGLTYSATGTDAKTYEGAFDRSDMKVLDENGNDVTENYVPEYVPGKLVITPADISTTDFVVSNPTDVTYNGLSQLQPVTVTDTRNGNVLTPGSVLAPEPTGDYTLAYTGETTHVTGQDIVITVKGTGNYTGIVTRTYQIKPATLTVKTLDATKEYDGTPLTKTDGATHDAVNGETLTINVTGTLTDVNEEGVPNTAEVVWDGTALPTDYEVNYDLGKLTVTPTGALVTISAKSAERVYDGTPLTEGGYDVAMDGVDPELFTVTATVSGSQTNAGTSDNVIDAESVHIMRGDQDVTAWFTNIANVNGTLTVTPASLTVTTDSASKTYDGQPLTAGGKLEGLVGDETATLRLTGSQTEPGTSDNTYQIVWDGTALEGNYKVTSEKIGTLKVTAAPAKPEPAKPAVTTPAAPTKQEAPKSAAMPKTGDPYSAAAPMVAAIVGLGLVATGLAYRRRRDRRA